MLYGLFFINFNVYISIAYENLYVQNIWGIVYIEKEDITLFCGDAFGDNNIFFLQFAVDTNREDLKRGLDFYNDVLFFAKKNIKSFRFRN